MGDGSEGFEGFDFLHNGLNLNQDLFGAIIDAEIHAMEIFQAILLNLAIKDGDLVVDGFDDHGGGGLVVGCAWCITTMTGQATSTSRIC
jgi:hypothetical protein